MTPLESIRHQRSQRRARIIGRREIAFPPAPTISPMAATQEKLARQAGLCAPLACKLAQAGSMARTLSPTP